jgi:peptide/nickel transport system substrate-binding protein
MKSAQKNKLILVSLLLFTACQNTAPTSTPGPVQPIAQQQNTLTICLGDEPDSLYRYQPMEKSAGLVMQAIYDGPIDMVNGKPVPVILDSLPSLEDGSTQFLPVTVNPGDTVVDTLGNITLLQKGVEVFPSGCRESACAVVYDGESPLEMDQLKAIYRLKNDITWSDGQPITTADLLFSFEVASDPVTPIDHFYTDLTGSYTALDWLTIEWKGLPGWIIDRFEHFFWSPLPAHIYGIYSSEQLLAQSDVNRQPLGWGPYMISKWVLGESIELVRNPFYYRASEGLPHFDKLIFRITNPTGDTNLANLKFDREPFSHLDYGIGEFEDEIAQNGCDLTTTTADMRDQMTVFNYLLNYYQDPAIQVVRSEETETQFLLFNLDTDRGVAPQQSLAVRKAVSQCIDHGRLVQALSNNLFGVPQLIDIGLPDQLESTLDFLNYASEPAKEDLEAAGWVDHDSNHRTPRISLGIEGISDGREMVMNLLIEQGNETENAATLLQPMLEDCGIGINAIIQPKEVIWNPEEENSLFYDEFDIAFLAWSTPIQDPCLLFAGDQIPDLSKNKFGSNFSRFNNTRVNEICAEFTYQMPTSKLRQLMAELQEIINVELPIVPLYSFSALLTAQKDFCFEGLDETYANELAGIEEFRIIAECP